MGKMLKDAINHNTGFWVCLIVSIALLITSFILPPTGTIDNSVILASSELFAFAALGAVYKGIDKGVDATVKHNSTEITLNNPDNNDNPQVL